MIHMKTNYGTIVLELNPEKAPKSVANFLAYAKDGFYDGTLFHRVIDKFVIQGGGFGPGMTQKMTRPPIENEANNGLRNARGSLAMARATDPHSATSQFFINIVDNDFLNYTAPTPAGATATLVGTPRISGSRSHWVNRVSASEPEAPSCPVVPNSRRRSGMSTTTVVPSRTDARTEVSAERANRTR